MKPLIATYSATAPNLDAAFDSPEWATASPVRIDHLWQGDPAPPELTTTARILWTDDELIIGYECLFTELDMDDEYDVAVERYGLWDRDVCEAFIRSPIEPAITSYKEFEVAPTAQWCDLRIDRVAKVTDWEWKSRMRTGSRIDKVSRVWWATMALPFECFGEHPSEGGEWSGNLFRVGRLDGDRKYLAYSPNSSETPNFHVPESFVPLKFLRR